ncbi:MAG: SprB repeat-containing protein, partial [Bacteroidota bacterium]
MKKRTLITITFLCFYCLNAVTQTNCYNNPSIEGTSQAHVVPSPWNTCWGSPDTQPGQWGITLPASDGSTYVSFLASNNYSYLEGMTQPLTTCMVAGETYTFSVDLAHSNVYNTAGPGDCYSSFAVWGGNSSCDRAELLYCSGEIWNTNWQTYSITFTPTGNWCYIGFSPCYLTSCSGYINLLMDNISCISPVQAMVTSTDVTCYNACNGTATASPTSGTPPFTYSWAPGGQTTATITNLCPGTYTVTVTDAGSQTTTADAIIAQPSALIITPSQTNVSCLSGSNGSATATASGGTSPYTYLWSNSGTTPTISGLTAGSYSVTVTDANGCQTTTSYNINDGGIVSAYISASVDVSCAGGNNGTATVTVTDGTPFYNYLWSNGQTTQTAVSLTASSYTVQVTDSKGCSTTVNVTITEPPLLNASIFLTTDASCSGSCNGQATVTASGGTGAYTYLWDNGQTIPNATGLCAGTENVTVTDANGCTTSASATINEPPPLAMSETITDPGCTDSCNGNVVVSVIGGTFPYTYQWNDSYSQTTATAYNLCDGTYIITVTDNNGCVEISTVVLTDPPLFVASIATSIDVDCNGNCNGYAQVSVSGGGGPPYTYLWTNGQTTDQAIGLCPGSYSVTATNNNGCTSSASTVINEPPPLTSTISSSNVTCFEACNGSATVTVSGGMPPYTYQWNDPMFQTTQTAINLCSQPGGTLYTVFVTDLNGCIISKSVTITQPQELGLLINVVSPTTCSSNNGGACVSAYGGISPYTIVWNDINSTVDTCISNVYAGVFNPIVTDAMGCTDTVTVIINDIAGPTIDSIITTDIECFGNANGTAKVYISGGTSPFTYIWQDNFGDTIATGVTFISGLSGGIHTAIIVDAFDCLESEIFNIYEPPLLVSAITSITNTSCFGVCNGVATVSVSGGTAPYNYSWSPGGQTSPTATALCAGIYFVYITDSFGCST